ncbi:unnamed protein product [Thelazia callipaeda]|uniref:Keratin, type II cytoskeletal 2 oral-like n=1 Tax=Thelazia callipaeda TaxID=103827 RepID=A0A0N5CQJ3_THECL|nr:unnamed protein product [Thelazia callipaeda]
MKLEDMRRKTAFRNHKNTEKTDEIVKDVREHSAGVPEPDAAEYHARSIHSRNRAYASQKCCLAQSLRSSDERLINIVIPSPYHSTFGSLGFGGLGGLGIGGLDGLGLGGLTSGFGGLLGLGYFGYFTRYLGPANMTGSCPAGVNINGQCWFNSIGDV